MRCIELDPTTVQVIGDLYAGGDSLVWKLVPEKHQPKRY